MDGSPLPSRSPPLRERVVSNSSLLSGDTFSHPLACATKGVNNLDEFYKRQRAKTHRADQKKKKISLKTAAKSFAESSLV
jgi:hypothetical protein